MRAPIFAIILLAALCSAFAASADQWTRYASADSSFSVLMPVYPKIRKDGRMAVSSPDKHESYLVDYVELEKSKTYIAAKLFTAVDGALTKNGGTILSTDNFAFDGHPAQDLKIRTQKGYRSWNRMIIANNRLYQLIYVTDIPNAPEPDRFWGSLHLSP